MTHSEDAETAVEPTTVAQTSSLSSSPLQHQTLVSLPIHSRVPSPAHGIEEYEQHESEPPSTPGSEREYEGFCWWCETSLSGKIRFCCDWCDDDLCEDCAWNTLARAWNSDKLPARCPSCNVEYTPGQVAKFKDPQITEDYEIAFATWESFEEYKRLNPLHCATPQCSAWIEYSTKEEKTFFCPCKACDFKTCVLCRQAEAKHIDDACDYSELEELEKVVQEAGNMTWCLNKNCPYIFQNDNDKPKSLETTAESDDREEQTAQNDGGLRLSSTEIC